ncbi:hypothetical protein [Amycolatopsis taiwanensis]|uniref:hypothetical protein n=1 Tax=Amycolatopsis taiwanensis TaxID=342230 RepID=UPI000481B0FF|nr:hypothetical protein [Amycolatopsis taiwanensis]
MSARNDTASPLLARVLAADAVWDALGGVALVAMPFAGAGVSVAWWPVLVPVGAACLVFAGVLAWAAGGRNMTEIGAVTAVANAVAVVVAVVLLVAFPGLAAALQFLLVALAVGCAVFAVLEWRATRGARAG